MVFSDTGDLHGGFYDSNAGVDYHVPVRGARTGPPPLRVVHVSVEMAPIAKVLCCAKSGCARARAAVQARAAPACRSGPRGTLVQERVGRLCIALQRCGCFSQPLMYSAGRGSQQVTLF